MSALPSIKFTATLRGGSDVARLLNRYPEKVGRSLESLVKQEARGLAVELARNTRPFGFSQKAKKRGEKAVAGDILKVFATPDQAYESGKAADSTHADRFWANIQNRRFARARQALAESPSKWRDLPVGRLEPKHHQESRTGPYANVTRREPAQIEPDWENGARGLIRLRRVGRLQNYPNKPCRKENQEDVSALNSKPVLALRQLVESRRSTRSPRRTNSIRSRSANGRKSYSMEHTRSLAIPTGIPNARQRLPRSEKRALNGKSVS